MGGIFRITKAEFIKIFKKPSVYIMGLLLAVVITVSLFTFQPTNRITNSANITGTSVSDMNVAWNAGLATDAKSNLDENVTTALDMITYYENFTARTTEVQTALADFLEARANLDNSIQNGAQDLTYLYDVLKTKMQDLITVYTSDYNMDIYSFYNLYKTSETYTTYYHATEPYGYINILQDKLNTDTATNFNTFFNTNDYATKLTGLDNVFITETLNARLENIVASYEAYNSLIVTSSNFTFVIAMEEARQNLSNSIVAFKSYLTSLNSSNNPIFVMSSTTYDATMELLDNANTILGSVSEDNGDTLFDRYKSVLNQYKALSVSSALATTLNELELVSLSQEKIDELKEFINVKIGNITTAIQTSITEFVSENGATILSNKKNELLNMFTNYKTTTLNAITYIENELAFEILTRKTASEMQDVKDYETFNLYEAKETNVKIDYLIANTAFDQDFADVFSYGVSTTNDTNAWDFMFYAMKLSSIFIVLFAIIMASNILAYEFDTGTIKLLAIRPFKRHKILFGKMLAVMSFVAIFVLFSALIAFVAGWSSFPVTTMAVLGVFNASTAYVMSPFVLMLINILAIILEVFFYVVIALSISTIFRSFAGAMTTSVVAYMFAMVLNLVFAGTLWYSYIPFVNTDFFRFMGGMFNSPLGNTGLSGLFSVELLSNSSLALSATIYLTTTVLITSLAYMVFKKRDI